MIDTAFVDRAQTVPIAQARFREDEGALVVVCDGGQSMPMSPFYLIGLPIPPPPKPKLAVSQWDLQMEKLSTREWSTSQRVSPLAWSSNGRMLIDRRIRLWRLGD